MAIHIYYHECLEDKVAFDVSPAIEVCYALHCIAFPDHHDLQREWIEETRAKLPTELFEEIISFGQGPSDRWAGATWLWEQDCNSPFELDMSRAKSLPAEELRARVDEVRAARRTLLPSEVAFMEALNQNPEGWRDEACALMEAFWPYFLPTWQRLESAFCERLRQLERRRQDGVRLTELLPGMAPQIAFDPLRGEIVVATLVEATIESERVESLRLTPTFFGIPHLWTDVTTNVGIDVWVEDALGPPRRQSPAELAESLKALGDARRLEILSLVLDKPRSAREVSEELGIGLAAANRHFQALTQIGLVQQVGSARAGAFARYEADPRAVSSITDALARLIHRRTRSEEAG